MKYSDKELGFIVDRIDKQSYELTEWELGYFESVKKRVRAGLSLSPKQAECLSKIWDKFEGI